MSGPEFFDSNILCYTDDADAPAKRDRALELWEESRQSDRAVISVQVLQEYFAVATRKMAVDPAIAIEKMLLFKRAVVIVPDGEDAIQAARLCLEHRLSYWDGMIVNTALMAGCARLYSEDLQHGRRYAGLEVINPITGQ